MQPARTNYLDGEEESEILRGAGVQNSKISEKRNGGDRMTPREICRTKREELPSGYGECPGNARGPGQLFANPTRTDGAFTGGARYKVA